jgi:hypothetical protein
VPASLGNEESMIPPSLHTPAMCSESSTQMHSLQRYRGCSVQISKIHQVDRQSQRLSAHGYRDRRDISQFVLVPAYRIPMHAFIQSFNGRLRQECLNKNWFGKTGARTTTIIDRTPRWANRRRASLWPVSNKPKPIQE